MKYAIALKKLMEANGKNGRSLEKVTGHTSANISRLVLGKIRSVRFSTLFAICDELDCSPGDILLRITDEEALNLDHGVFLVDLGDDKID